MTRITVPRCPRRVSRRSRRQRLGADAPPSLAGLRPLTLRCGVRRGHRQSRASVSVERQRIRNSTSALMRDLALLTGFSAELQLAVASRRNRMLRSGTQRTCGFGNGHQEAIGHDPTAEVIESRTVRCVSPEQPAHPSAQEEPGWGCRRRRARGIDCSHVGHGRKVRGNHP
jgi:hypothetical protein